MPLQFAWRSRPGSVFILYCHERGSLLQRDSEILCSLTFLQALNVPVGKNLRNPWGGHLAGCVLYAVAAGNRFDRRGYSETPRAWANSRHPMRTNPVWAMTPHGLGPLCFR